MDSLEFSVEMREDLPDSIPWYLAVQDGMAVAAVSEQLASGKWAGLFLGGTDRFKAETALAWALLAHRHKKRFHYGRASTLARIRACRYVRADSFDSTIGLWTRERFAKYVEWCTERDPQSVLF
jgi:hypothetical protein